MKAVEKNIYSHKGGYVVRKNNKYMGYYKDLEEARRKKSEINWQQPKKVRYMRTIRGFSDRLQQSIGASGKDISQIARETSITVCNIYEYIRGNSLPSCINLVKLSANLNVSADYLLGLSDIKELRK